MEVKAALIVTLAICGTLLVLQAQPASARGGRGGGGARGGRGSYSSRSSGSYRGSSAQYRAYRSSGGYGGYSTRRYNYFRSNSYYLSYAPRIRYTRSYTAALMGAVYWSYYSRYYYYSNSAIYARRSTPSSNTKSSVCANYAAGENDTYMGLFVCPLDFEPPKFTACCGDDYEEYCCEEKTELSTTAIVFITIGCITVVFAAVYIFCYCKKKNSVNEAQSNTALQQQRQQQGGRINNPRPVARTHIQPAPHSNYGPPLMKEGMHQNQGQMNAGVNQATAPPPGNLMPLGFDNVAYSPPSPAYQQEVLPWQPGQQAPGPPPPPYPGRLPSEEAVYNPLPLSEVKTETQ